MPTRSALVLALPFALLACTAEEPPMITDPGPPGFACGADELRDLVGRPASVLEQMKFAQPTRVIRPGMAVTMDYSPGRLNIEIDAKETISRISCG